MRSPLMLTALLLSGCMTSPPLVSGPYASNLSPSDIQQIQSVIALRPNIEHQVRTLEAQRPNRVYVRTGRGPSAHDWSGDALYVIKRSDGWHIDDRSPTASVARIPATY